MKAKHFYRDLRLYSIVLVAAAACMVVYIWNTVPAYTKKALPRLSFVRDFRFINQDDKPITQENIAGKIVVVNFFFTTCQGICPKMNGNMKKVYDRLRMDPNIVILSHTVDPQTDSPDQLRKYANRLGVDNKNTAAKWYFLTGDKLALYRQARESYTLDDPNNNVGSIDDQFIHTQFFALVDKTGGVRKVFDGLIDEQIQELFADIDDLEHGRIRDN